MQLHMGKKANIFHVKVISLGVFTPFYSSIYKIKSMHIKFLINLVESYFSSFKPFSMV